jgi:hypothetical protein
VFVNDALAKAHSPASLQHTSGEQIAGLFRPTRPIVIHECLALLSFAIFAFFCGYSNLSFVISSV